MVDSADTTVLVVEDEPAVVDAFTMMLEERFEILTAADGEEALAQAEDADVVLLDRMMPGMSGDEVLAEIRDRSLDCHVVMVSAVDRERLATIGKPKIKRAIKFNGPINGPFDLAI